MEAWWCFLLFPVLIEYTSLLRSFTVTFSPVVRSFRREAALPVTISVSSPDEVFRTSLVDGAFDSVVAPILCDAFGISFAAASPPARLSTSGIVNAFMSASSSGGLGHHQEEQQPPCHERSCADVSARLPQCGEDGARPRRAPSQNERGRRMPWPVRTTTRHRADRT